MDWYDPAEQQSGPVSESHNCQCADAVDGFKHLQAHVATRAFDSDDNVDAPKCHPNTRVAVLDEIMAWITLAVTRIQWILWLNGAAGAGKSAIGRSIVEFCLAQNIPIARFFFFRTDPTRNNVTLLVATIVHQIIQQLPDLKAIIIPRIQNKPLVFTETLHTQLEYLIFEPLRELAHVTLSQAVLVLLFDGVDECTDVDDQVSLIRTISKFIGSTGFPVIAFFGSRPEPQITSAFRSEAISKRLLQLPLDDHYLPDADIRLYLNDSFAKMNLPHSLNHRLDDNWPPLPEDVEVLVENSSGQFIYASVVIEFISTGDLHPAQQLDIILGLRPAGRLTPFAQLDALYLHIFSQVQDIDRVAQVLAWQIFGQSKGFKEQGDRYRTMRQCSAFFDINMDDILTAFAGLTSVIKFKGQLKSDGDDWLVEKLRVGSDIILTHHSPCTLTFLHASLPDFLLDISRSKQYHLDSKTWNTRLAVVLLSSWPRLQQSPKIAIDEHAVMDLCEFLPKSEMVPELRQYVVKFRPSQDDMMRWDVVIMYLQAFRSLDLGDGPYGAVYQNLLRYIAQFGLLKVNSYIHNLEDIRNIINIGLRLDATGQTSTQEADIQEEPRHGDMDPEWAAREAAIRLDERSKWAAREVAIRLDERREWQDREEAVRLDEGREWAIRVESIRRQKDPSWEKRIREDEREEYRREIRNAEKTRESDPQYRDWQRRRGTWRRRLWLKFQRPWKAVRKAFRTYIC